MKTSKSDINLLKYFVETKTKPIDIITSRTNIINRTDIKSKEEDLNFSLYVDNLSLSNSPDNIINKMYPKQNDKWVDSNLIYQCQECDITFNFLTRKHHCRACGGVFCSTCCNKYTDIPDNLIKEPLQDKSIKISITDTIKWFSGNTKKLVCNICDSKIKDLDNVKNLIKIFEYVDLQTL